MLKLFSSQNLISELLYVDNREKRMKWYEQKCIDILCIQAEFLVNFIVLSLVLISE